MAPLHLLEDIIIKIIHRLPFRSVLQWKRVSKQWKDLINDPKFYKLYTDNSSTAFFICRDGLYCVFISDVDDDDRRNIPPFTVHRVLIPAKGRSCLDNPEFLGSSSGIACVMEANGRFLLYNLFTGRSLVTVVRNFPPQETSYYRSCICHGFGYDRYADDYKILVCYCWEAENGLFWIYSLRNKDWNGFPYQAYPNWWRYRLSYSFNGVLHWCLVAADDKQNIKEVIVTYDLHTNRFGEIQAPPTAAAASLDGIVDCWLTTVAELNGQLCCVRKMRRYSQLVRRTVVWVMKEYGVGDSWERFATIECDLLYTYGMEPTTLLYKHGGRLVLFVCEDSPTLIWYDIDENKVEVVSKEIWQEEMKKIRNGGDKRSNLAI